MPALVGLVGMSIAFSGMAFGGAPQIPKIAATEATFVVPAGSSSMWALRLWSHGILEGSSSASSGMLVVAVPATADCRFQADVRVTPPGGTSRFFSGTQAHVAGCGPPTGTISGHVFLCDVNGAPTTTEVPDATLGASGPEILASQANPLASTTVASGTYTMAAGPPSGYLFVICGGSATVDAGGLTASEPVAVPSGGAGTGVFYVSAPPVAAGGGGPVASEPTPSFAASVVHDSSAPLAASALPTAPTLVAPSHLAFTGMSVGPPLLIGILLLGLGTLALAVSRARRLTTRPVRVPVSSNGAGQHATHQGLLNWQRQSGLFGNR